jgi:hypothetical protein
MTSTLIALSIISNNDHQDDHLVKTRKRLRQIMQHFFFR